MPDSTIDDQIRQLAETLDVALLLRDVEPARYVYVSPGFERIFGRPAAALLTNPNALIEFAHPDDRGIVAARIADRSQGPAPEIEWRILRPDGCIRWVRATRAFVAARAGDPDRIAGFVEDITERRAADFSLAQTREWFDALSDAVPIGSAIRDAATRDYAYISSAYEQIAGRPPADFYDDPAASFAPTSSDDLPILDESSTGTSNGEAWSYEGRVVRPDGEVHWVRGHQVGVVGNATGHRWLASTAEDVTDLRAKETQRRCLIDANIVGVMTANTDHVVNANDHYLHIIGYTRTDLVDGLVRWQEITPPEWRTATETAAAELSQRGACTPYEKELLRKNGTRVPVLISSAIVEQEPLTFSTFVLDLTKMKRLEAALHDAETEAERSNKATSSFMSRMSHDLRSPLNAVLGFGQLLKLDDLNTNQRESVEQILNAGNHLLALINDMPDISRNESELDSS